MVFKTFTKNKVIIYLSSLLLLLYFNGDVYGSSNDGKNILEIKDHVIVVKNNSVVFDILQTEEENQSPVTIRVIEQPKFGAVTLNDNQAFEYTPLHNLCEKDDLLVYEMVYDNQVIEVSVFVEILCESLTIMNGMGMDRKIGEKILDNFTILGVQNFPDNTLHIFDDNGNQIFQKEGYANDWNGKLENEELLEKNRMYYYVFNDGGGNYYSGYLQIN